MTVSTVAGKSTAIVLKGPLAYNGTGRVEVFYSGQWGTICDDIWDFNDAKVACRQLGYKYAVRSLQGGLVPNGAGKIWLDQVSCTGNEQSLTGCPHAPWGSHDCTHGEDAGVECSSTGTMKTIRVLMHVCT